MAAGDHLGVGLAAEVDLDGRIEAAHHGISRDHGGIDTTSGAEDAVGRVIGDATGDALNRNRKDGLAGIIGLGGPVGGAALNQIEEPRTQYLGVDAQAALVGKARECIVGQRADSCLQGGAVGDKFIE